MKIVNETTGALSIDFSSPGTGGCGYIKPGGPPLEKHFDHPVKVSIAVDVPNMIVYDDVGDGVTITVLSKIDGGE